MKHVTHRLAILSAAFLLFFSIAAKTVGRSAAAWKKERLAALPAIERTWLTEFVAPIIIPEEEKLFLELNEPYQREVFKEEFWARREKVGLRPPMGPGYRLRYEELRRLADLQYDGWKQDAGRLVIRYGEPASVDKTDLCVDTLRGVEIWKYNNFGASGRGEREFILYRPSLASPRRLWDSTVPDSALFNPGKSLGLAELALRCGTPAGRGGQEAATCGEMLCKIARLITQARADQAGAGIAVELAKIFEPEPISTEGLEQLRNRFAIMSDDPNTKRIHVEGPSGSTATTSPSGGKEAGARVNPRRKLTAQEAKDLTKKLDQRYREWLELAAPLLTEDDLSTFLQLDDRGKDEFIEKFWKSHS